MRKATQTTANVRRGGERAFDLGESKIGGERPTPKIARGRLPILCDNCADLLRGHLPSSRKLKFNESPALILEVGPLIKRVRTVASRFRTSVNRVLFS